jgi:agmatinase
MPQQSAAEYLRHGQTPFFRLPVVTGDVRGHDAAILGVPYDGGTTFRPGARLGPYAARRVSALVGSYHPVHKVDVFQRLRVVDGGNVAFPPFDAAAVRGCIEGAVAAVAAAGAAPFVVGGDHTLTFPAVRALAERIGPVALVHIDAHADTSGPEVWGDRFHHGTPIRHLLDEGCLSGLWQVGLRGPWGTSEEGLYARARGATVYPIEVVEARGVATIAAEIRAAVAERPLYISFDVDGVDPAFAPGTGTPLPGGLTAREGFALLRGLAGARISGGDVVELAPDLDVGDITAHLAAHVIYEMLALKALSV